MIRSFNTLRLLDQFKFFRGSFRKRLEEKLAQNPQEAFHYAMFFLQDRFPAGEKAMASDPDIALRYARRILRGPFPEAEDVIAAHASEWDRMNKTMGAAYMEIVGGINSPEGKRFRAKIDIEAKKQKAERK